LRRYGEGAYESCWPDRTNNWSYVALDTGEEREGIDFHDLHLGKQLSIKMTKECLQLMSKGIRIPPFLVACSVAPRNYHVTSPPITTIFYITDTRPADKLLREYSASTAMQRVTAQITLIDF